MTAIRTKICGLTRVEDVHIAVEAGADYLGLVLWPESPRGVDLDRGAALAMEARACGFTGGLVGVFVDATHDDLGRAADACDLDVLQLHGTEDVAAVTRAATLRPVWKAIRVGADHDAATLAGLADATGPVAAILLDTYVPGTVGGTGERFRWDVARELAASREVVLAGGLTSDVVADAITTVGPFAVDVSSGVESRPGVKDPARVRAFLDAVGRSGA